MSAYVTNSETLHYLANAACSVRPGIGEWSFYSNTYGHTTCDRIARFGDHARPNCSDRVTRFGMDDIAHMLRAEGIKSINARYPDTVDNLDNAPGTIGDTGPLPKPFPSPMTLDYEPLVVLSLIAGYEYQSCEHSGWKGSPAWEFCQALRVRMITELDGYESAPWEIDQPIQAANARFRSELAQ